MSVSLLLSLSVDTVKLTTTFPSVSKKYWGSTNEDHVSGACFIERSGGTQRCGETDREYTSSRLFLFS